MSRTGDESRRSSADTPEDTQLLYDRANPPTAASTGVGTAAMAYPGIEVVSSSDNDKQASQAEKEALYSEHLHRGAAESCQPGKDTVYPEPLDKGAAEPFIHSDKGQVTSQSQPVNRRVCGLRLWIFWASLVAVVLVMGVALGAGLGVGLNKEGSEGMYPNDDQTSASSDPSTPAQSQFEIGGTIDSSYYSKQNAWNGTGLSYNWQDFPSSVQNQPANNQSLVLYYQHYSGQIRWMRRAMGGAWRRGAKFEVVTDAAKNSTPISAAKIQKDGSDIWDVFYVSDENMVRQRSRSNTSQEWTDGSINNLNLSAYDGDLVGLHACTVEQDPTIPLRLWYASNDATFEEYVLQGDEWAHEKTWNGYNGAAGISCFSKQEDFIYVALVNQDNALEFWYRDITDSSSEWKDTGTVIDDVHPATSVSLSRYYCVLQKRDQARLSISWVRWNNETVKFDAKREILTEHSMTEGTRIAAVADDSQHLIFSQAVGDDIEESSRSLDDFTTAWVTDDIASGA